MHRGSRVKIKTKRPIFIRRLATEAFGYISKKLCRFDNFARFNAAGTNFFPNVSA
jgi:hypothetical protein